jgi:hypothetical protein
MLKIWCSAFIRKEGDGKWEILNNSTRRILLADFLDDIEDILKYRVIKKSMCT